MLNALHGISLKHRADLLSQQRAALERIHAELEPLTRNAHQRGDATDTNHALEIMEALTDLAQNVALQMRHLLSELLQTQHNTEKETTK